MYSQIALVYYVLGFQLLWEVCSDPQIVFKTRNLECKPSPRYAVNSTCLVKAKNWNNAVAQMDCDIVTPLYNITTQVELFRKGYNNRFYPFLVNIIVNVCDIMAKRNFTPYTKIIGKLLKDFTNVNHSCPIMGRVSARNLYIRDVDFPLLPLGVYLCSLHTYENFANGSFAPVGVINLYFEAMDFIKPKNKPKKI